jgi:hypothetical protein
MQFRLFVNSGIEKPLQFPGGEDVRFPAAFLDYLFPFLFITVLPQLSS